MKRMLIVLVCFGLVFSSSGGSLAAEEKVLNVYNWTDYLPDGVIKAFTKETGIKVNYSTYDSNETLYAKLKTLKGKGYDVVVPSSYFIDRMRKEGMLLELDKSKLSNFKNLDPKRLDQPYDPGNRYSVPYLWGTTGIAVNKKLVDPSKVTRWDDLWDAGYKDSILLLDDVRDVFAMALKTLGYSINDTNEVHIREAYGKLKEILPNVKLFNSETPKSFYIGEEVALGMNWNGETRKAMRENPNIVYIYPAEGAMIWTDSLAIPAGAKHPDNAHRFIDFLMRPEIAKTICEDVGGATPNLEAINLLPSDISGDRTIYPTDEDLKKSEIQNDVGEAISIYEKYWEMLKAGR